MIARCLLEPGFLEAAATETDLRSEVRVQFPKVELERIQRFAGFICKVQHNYLWESFGATRQLLRYFDLEFDIFTRYHPHHLRIKTESVDERIRQFVNFLDQHFSTRANLSITQMLLEVLRHERLIWESRLADVPQPAPEILPSGDAKGWQWTHFQRLLVQLNPQLRVRQFRYNVESIVARLATGTFDAEFRRGGNRFLAYSKDRSSGSVRVVQLDRITVHLLSLVNGHRSVRAVIGAARAAGLGHAQPLSFRAFFEEAAHFGFIQFSQKRG